MSRVTPTALLRLTRVTFDRLRYFDFVRHEWRPWDAAPNPQVRQRLLLLLNGCFSCLYGCFCLLNGCF